MRPKRKRTFPAGKEGELRKKQRLSDDKVAEMLYDSDSEDDKLISDSEDADRHAVLLHTSVS